MTIAKRLILLLAVPLVALVALGVFVRLQLADIEARSRFVAESRIVALATLGDLSRSFSELRVTLSNHLLVNSETERITLRQAFDQDEQEMNRLLQTYADNLVQNDRDRRLLSDYQTLSRDWITSAKEVVALANEGRETDAAARLNGRLAQLAKRIGQVSSEWMLYNREIATNADHETVASIAEFRQHMLISNTSALLLTGLLGFLTFRRIVRPICALEAAVKRIADALGKKVEGHYLGQQAKSDEEAAYATLGLEAAENIKSAADSSMMVMSLFGGQYVDAAYQAATGYVEGGPEEAVLRTASMFGHTAGAAAEAMRGYREGGMEGAVKRGAVSFATSKGIEYGMGRVLGKAKNVDGPDAPPVKKGVDAPDAPSAKSAPTGQKNLSALPSSADQRALEQFKQARNQGENLAEDFSQAQKRLANAGASGAPAEEIMRLQAEVREKVAQVNGSPHAKNFLKYKGDAGSQRAYNAHLRAVHADVEAKFHANMQANGWNQPPLKEFRNAASAGAVGMDFDIGLDAQMARSISRDGKPAKVNDWQQDAQKAWNDAYKASTGLEAEKAWETITTHAHAESYKDMAWLAKDKSGVSKIWSQQAADVTRYKSWHMMNDASLDKMTRLQEISRGAAKDMQTKLNPILDKVKPTGKSLTALHAELVADEMRARIEGSTGMFDSTGEHIGQTQKQEARFRKLAQDPQPLLDAVAFVRKRGREDRKKIPLRTLKKIIG